MILLYNFLSVFHKSSTGDLRSPKNTDKTQKLSPYRKTSKVHFPFTIISSHVNYVVKTSIIEMQLFSVIYVSFGYIWGVINLTLLIINIFKDQLTDPWFYLSCCSTILPFGNLTDKDFSCSILNKNYIEISNKNSSVLLKPPPNLELLFNQFNNSSPEQ